MQNSPRFRYTLISPDLGTETLAHDPVGWEEEGFTLHRDPQLHGMTTEYSTTFGFIKAGRRFLEAAYQLGGIEAEVTVLTEYYNPNTFLWDEYRRARVDFVSRELTATEFRCLLTKEGLTQRFLNRDATPIDLFKGDSVNGTQLPAVLPVALQLHSRAIVQRYKAAVAPPAPEPIPGDLSNTVRRALLYFGFGNAETNEFGLQEVFGGPVTDAQLGDEVPIYTTKERGEFRFSFRADTELHVSRTGNGYGNFDEVEGQYYFRINDEPPVVLHSFHVDDIGGTFNRPVTLEHQETRTLEIGDRVYLFAAIHVFNINAGVLGTRFTISNDVAAGSFFEMSAESSTEPTTCDGLLVYEALNRVAQSLTDQNTAFRSAFFGRTDSYPAYPQDGPGSLLFTASGFLVRGFPLDVKPLTTTWRDLYGSLSAVYNLGCGVERLPEGQEVVRVEELAYWYSDAITLDLPEPVELTVKTLPDRHFASAEVGYQKWETGQVNGLDEFNAKRTYTTPLTQVDGRYSAISPYVASGFHLELTRRSRYDATATTDTSTDSDQYLICVLRTPGGYETERTQRFAEVSGLFSPDTAYNLRLSPARLLRRHAPHLAAGLQYQRGKAVRFAAGEGNNTLRTRLLSEAEPVVENADVPVAALGQPLWRPEGYSFSAPLRHEQAAAVLRHPRGRIRFRDQTGQRHEGWLIDFTHQAAGADGPTARFELLACAVLTPSL